MRVNKAIASYGTIIFALLVASAPPAASAQAPNAMNREEAIAVIREMRRIVTPQGVDRSETIRIGGINQELVGWLRNEFSKDKIFLLGHSWGSFVGLEFARRHPEWLHAYIGVGQATNTPESERRGYAFALAAARRAGNAEAVTQLESIAPYAAPGQPIPLEDIIIERRWSDYFGGVMAYRERQVNGIASRLSPDYSDEDAPRVFEGNNYSSSICSA